ncbi:hypothetical protein GCM10023156_26470 [Novipirellula rosea]|uniref:Uncharacterized protein n=1 Tax=Novipirellula rosea TaxID=1031540 RepID=A0ABP8MSU6_9BACT
MVACSPKGIKVASRTPDCAADTEVCSDLSTWLLVASADITLGSEEFAASLSVGSAVARDAW